MSLAVEAFGAHFVNSARVGGEDKTFNLVTDLPLLRKTTVNWDGKAGSVTKQNTPAPQWRPGPSKAEMRKQIEAAMARTAALNLKTAKAIGHEVPASLVLRADKVIE